MKQNRDICPRKAFYKNLLSFLAKSISDGFSLVVYINTNKHVELGLLARSFRVIVLINYIHQIISALHSLSYIIRSSLIDTIWVSADIEVKASSICPYAFSIGNYQAIIVDISYSSMIGSPLVPIHLPSIYQLISSNLIAVKSYLE